MEAIFLNLFHFFRKRRLWLFVAVIAIISVAVFLASRIKLEEDITRMISGSDKTGMLTKIVEQSEFLDKIIITLSTEDITYKDSLEKAGDRLADTLLSPAFQPYVKEVTYKISDTVVEAMFNLVYNNLPLFLEEEDYAAVDSAILPHSIDRSVLNVYRNLLSPASFAMKKMILRDPLGISSIALKKLGSFQNDENYTMVNSRIYSRDTTSLMLFISPVYKPKETSKNVEFADILRNTLKEIGSEYNVEAAAFGSALIAAGNADRLKRDIRLTLSISIILLTLIISFSIRKKKLFPFIFLPAVFGGILALAVLFLLKGKVSVISLSIGSVILAITVDYALHITTHYKHRHSIIGTIKDVSFPIIVCGFATAFEFLALVFVSSESLKELGILAAISVVTAAFFTMVVLPHILEMSTGKADETEEKNLLEWVLDKITRYAFHKKKLLLAAMVIYSIASLFYLSRVGFESDMMKMNYMSADLRKAESKLDRINNASLNSIYVVSYGNNIQKALESNERVISRASDLKSEGIVSNYTSPASLLMSDSVQQQKIQKWNEFWSNHDIAAVINTLDAKASRTGFRSGSFEEFTSLLGNSYSPDSNLFRTLQSIFSIENISVNPEMTSIVTALKVRPENVDKASASFADIQGAMVIDRKSALSGIVDTLGDDFNFIANVSLLLILLVLILAFGRLELGIITFVPIFLSWIWTLGFMGMTGIKFNIFNIIISSFITGLGIDYSIYIMQGLVQGYKSDNHNLLSYKTCILISVMISISGTGVMILAKHPALNSIAIISIFGLLAVVLISYTFEPLLFNYLVSKNNKPRVLPVTLSDILTTIVVFTIFVIGCVFMNAVLLLVWIIPVKKEYKKLWIHYAIMLWCRIPVYAMIHIRKSVVNTSREDFSKPALIISNHQSHIDLLLLLMLNPKLIVLTTKWVWNNPIYMLVIRYLNYYPVMEGYGDLMEKISDRVKEGYSVIVFPEGSRSADSSITRFHKGAFLMAHTLGLDLLPVIIHGAGDCMNKGENHLRGGSITVKIFPRIKPGDPEYGADYHEMKNSMLRFYRQNYARMKEELETPDYFRRKLIRNYIYKGPVLEWYTRIKLSLENNYICLNDLIPRKATITDIGCGYGYLTHILSFVSSERTITAFDYDEDKIEVASGCMSIQPNVEFRCADVTTVDFTESDVFVLSDVLHYLPDDKQEELISRCMQKLKPGGKILIRDADRDLVKRHKGTRYTEFFSTRSGFNKSNNNRLYFFAGSKIRTIAGKNGFNIKESDQTKLTSNILYVLERA